MGSGIVKGFYRGLDDIFSHSDINEVEAASNYIEIWLKTARANDDLELELAACCELGSVYIVKGEYDKALNCFIQAGNVIEMLKRDGYYNSTGLCGNIIQNNDVVIMRRAQRTEVNGNG